jgi:hypothetical protein
MEGNDHGIIEVLTRHLPVQTEENDDKPQDIPYLGGGSMGG